MSLEILFRLVPECEEELHVSRTEPETPETWPTFALEEEDYHFISACRSVLSGLKKLDPSVEYYAQAEEANRHHLHLLVKSKKWTTYTANASLRKLTEITQKRLFPKSLNNPELNFELNITHRKCKRSGKNIFKWCESESYILNYFYGKQCKPTEDEDNVLWAWSNLENFKDNCLNLKERLRLFLANKPEEPVDPENPDPEKVIQLVPRKDKPNKNQIRFMETIDWLVNNAITTEREWAKADRTGYLSLLASTSGQGQIKRALAQAGHMMKETMEAKDYLVGTEPVTEEAFRENRIYKILTFNGYDPVYVASLMYGWSERQFGKRNTLWLYGPATTGKTIIAQAIAESVPFYAGVNWTNENFPFCNCPGKMLIWWEEGKMTQKIVESAKCILGGTRVPVDVKCKTAEICEPTPCIITSNTNMCQVFDGNSSSFEHTEPLQERMFRLRLNYKLPWDFGKVTKQEVKDFFWWGKNRGVAVQHAFEVAKAPQTINSALMEGARIFAAADGEKTSLPPRKRPYAREPDSDSPKVKKECSQTSSLNNVVERAGLNVITGENECLLHKVLNCLECYPELAAQSVMVDDADLEQ